MILYGMIKMKNKFFILKDGKSCWKHDSERIWMADKLYCGWNLVVVPLAVRYCLSCFCFLIVWMSYLLIDLGNDLQKFLTRICAYFKYLKISVVGLFFINQYASKYERENYSLIINLLHCVPKSHLPSNKIDFHIGICRLIRLKGTPWILINFFPGVTYSYNIPCLLRRAFHDLNTGSNFPLPCQLTQILSSTLHPKQFATLIAQPSDLSMRIMVFFLENRGKGLAISKQKKNHRSKKIIKTKMRHVNLNQSEMGVKRKLIAIDPLIICSFRACLLCLSLVLISQLQKVCTREFIRNIPIDNTILLRDRLHKNTLNRGIKYNMNDGDLYKNWPAMVTLVIKFLLKLTLKAKKIGLLNTNSIVDLGLILQTSQTHSYNKIASILYPIVISLYFNIKTQPLPLSVKQLVSFSELFENLYPTHFYSRNGHSAKLSQILTYNQCFNVLAKAGLISLNPETSTKQLLKYWCRQFEKKYDSGEDAVKLIFSNTSFSRGIVKILHFHHNGLCVNNHHEHLYFPTNYSWWIYPYSFTWAPFQAVVMNDWHSVEGLFVGLVMVAMAESWVLHCTIITVRIATPVLHQPLTGMIFNTSFIFLPLYHGSWDASNSIQQLEHEHAPAKCHPNSTCLHMYMFWHSHCAVCTVIVDQSLVESLLENGWSKNISFLGLSAGQLQAKTYHSLSSMTERYLGIPTTSKYPIQGSISSQKNNYLLSERQSLATPFIHLKILPPLPLYVIPLGTCRYSVPQNLCPTVSKHSRSLESVPMDCTPRTTCDGRAIHSCKWWLVQLDQKRERNKNKNNHRILEVRTGTTTSTKTKKHIHSVLMTVTVLFLLHFSPLPVNDHVCIDQQISLLLMHFFFLKLF
ncbi:hypothetical protein VP01_1258g3 [Puccinia sorghi]|uniref:Uncharacterized protein n=1 Tax=Puccinia sorghi TaxID=27349 RepID=A0A0L6VP98_9BASI|nr:hypothetical protein VP01_1258g3 [Puccinia sorghi]